MSAPSKRSYVFAYIVFPLAVLLFAPFGASENANVSWLLGLVIVLPVSFVAGLLSCFLYYGRHDPTSVDPFYVRAWWTMLGGAVAWPFCLLFRPAVAAVAFCLFTFGAGTVVAFHVYHRRAKRKET